MTQATTRVLQAVFADYGPASLLRSGEVRPDGFDFAFVDTGTPVQGMARMVRGLEFDVVDMSPTTFFAARSLGVPIVALPIAMYAEYPHPLIWCHKASDVRGPAGLAGKTVGVRTWLSPAGIYLRGMVKAQYGYAFDDVNWHVTVEDTLATQPLPPNVKREISDPKAFKLLEMVRTGECDAVIDALTLQWRHAVDQQKVDPLIVEPLFPDDDAGTRALFARFGFIPVMHLVVAKKATLDQSPGVAQALIDAFGAAKQRYIEALQSPAGVPAGDRAAWLIARDRDNTELLPLGIDPLPAGDAVVRTLTVLMEYMVDLGYLPERLDVRAQFAGI
jgi:4,5-dihydroxyphthalate decarboxylase